MLCYNISTKYKSKIYKNKNKNKKEREIKMSSITLTQATTQAIQNQNPELALLETFCHKSLNNINAYFFTTYVLNNTSEFQINNTNFNLCPTITYNSKTQEFYLNISFFKGSFKTINSIKKHLNYIKTGVSIINNHMEEYNTTYSKAIKFLCSQILYSQYLFKYKISNNPAIMCNYPDDLICYLLGSYLTAKQYKNYFYLTNNNILPIYQ